MDGWMDGWARWIVRDATHWRQADRINIMWARRDERNLSIDLSTTLFSYNNNNEKKSISPFHTFSGPAPTISFSIISGITIKILFFLSSSSIIRKKRRKTTTTSYNWATRPRRHKIAEKVLIVRLSTLSDSLLLFTQESWWGKRRREVKKRKKETSDIMYMYV